MLTIKQGALTDSQTVDTVQTEYLQTLPKPTVTYRVTFRNGLNIAVNQATVANVTSNEFDLTVTQGTSTHGLRTPFGGPGASPILCGHHQQRPGRTDLGQSRQSAAFVGAAAESADSGGARAAGERDRRGSDQARRQRLHEGDRRAAERGRHQPGSGPRRDHAVCAGAGAAVRHSALRADRQPLRRARWAGRVQDFVRRKQHRIAARGTGFGARLCGALLPVDPRATHRARHADPGAALRPRLRHHGAERCAAGRAQGARERIGQRRTRSRKDDERRRSGAAQYRRHQHHSQLPGRSTDRMGRAHYCHGHELAVRQHPAAVHFPGAIDSAGHPLGGL